ncbi:flagellar hook-basal body complex protein [Pseudoteredinibacter isoporae]|uniref:Flagellar hook protein FlgE n=1 Tax=Pseudoteredinibacter isoporae TaxID=570281 RepID=A0A7X0JY09_9GAMM|nr:flagellar hook-basal body complex protein [Pseudoteredinibacter isoporae]MBB6523496.1 flagellar hook protein FlgE [Pseudoteredinibacter isoporae]NHO89005.1 flagellar hook-basal body complex protein [Pseudoteredinibacter isoporae]NIB24287.1 flagellar hook-basal body complex protein [Pseudoteredinibacter isoporae]
MSSSFNIGLSGIRAANSDLSITGNNIANASTVGFKNSRAEFGDVYSNQLFGSALNRPGSGVSLQSAAQQFNQGSINSTSNVLDMAISGDGFFVVNQGGEQLYTRAGTFGLDNEGNVITNSGARLQGFGVDESGKPNGILSDLTIDASLQQPKQTSSVESGVNLDANEEVLERIGKKFSTDGNSVAVTQVGIANPTRTQVDGASTAFPAAGFDFSTDDITFDITLANAESGNNGTVSINLSTAQGLPANVDNYNDVRTLVNVINAQISSPTLPQTAIDVQAVAVNDGGGDFHIEFRALRDGEPSQITIDNGNGNETQIGLATLPATDNSGAPAVNNGYPAQSIDVVGPDGSTITYNSTKWATAAATSSELNALAGVTAKASTEARITATNFNNPGNNMVLELNDVALDADDLAGLATQINNLSDTSLSGISAEIVGGDLVIKSSIGHDLKFALTGGDDETAVQIIGNADAPEQILEIDTGGGLAIATATNAGGNAIVVGGKIDIQLEDGYEVNNLNPPALGLFQPFNANSFTDVVLNPFDPNDPKSYNHTTAVKVFDSLGNEHTMNQYFIKQKYDPAVAGSSPNHWKMVVTIDGKEVGDPDTSLPAPQNKEPTRAEFDLHFKENGDFNTALSDDVLISNWTPLDAQGQPLGTLKPLPVLEGGVAPVPQPSTTSNFTIDMSKSSQFGDKFTVKSVDQDGFATGRLTGLTISEEGIIFARFSNQESEALGQVALANFTNNQGLQPQGNTMWAESFDSGVPSISSPKSGGLGSVTASALEDSNVDLSTELVDLIIAQRNYQANAKTIETANQVTQTIINLR